MLINADSPLRRLPHALNPLQASELVGLRYAVEMLDLSYTQLVGNDLPLLERLTESPEAEVIRQPWGHTPALMHAWNIVDSAHRLRLVLDLMKVPSLDHSPLMKTLEAFRLIRNDVQHLDERIERNVARDAGQAVWGSLAWVHTYPSERRCTAYVAMPGSVQRQKGIPTVNPAGRELTVPIGAVELHAYGHRGELSLVHDLVEHFVVDVLTPQLTSQFEGHTTTGSDLVLALEIAFKDEPHSI